MKDNDKNKAPGIASWKDKSLEKGKTKRRLVSNTGTYLVLGLALLAMTFFGVLTPPVQETISGNLAAKVGGERVKRGEFLNSYNQLSNQYQQMFGGQMSLGQFNFAQMTMDRLVNSKVTYLVAREYGFFPSRGEVRNEILDQFDLNNNQEDFDATRFRRILKQNGLTEADLESQIAESLSTQSLFNFVEELSYEAKSIAALKETVQNTILQAELLEVSPTTLPFKPTKEEIQAFTSDEQNTEILRQEYESRGQEYDIPAKYELQAITIGHQGAKRVRPEALERSKEEAREIAEGIRAELGSNPATQKFRNLAAERSDDPLLRQKKGALGTFAEAELETFGPNFVDAVPNLDKGAVSEVIETPFGWMLVRLDTKTDRIFKPFEDVKEELAELALAKQKGETYHYELASQLLQDLQESPQQFQEKIGSLGLGWKKSGEFNAQNLSIPELMGAEVEDLFDHLKNEGDLYPSVVSTGRSQFLVRLTKKETKAPESGEDDKQMQKNQQLGFSILEAFREKKRDELDRLGDVYINKSYLRIGEQQNPANPEDVAG